MAEAKKYFWLRLKRDFFKRHDIRILESMPNGKEIVLFYLKLLTESIDHEGKLRFSETVPYTPKMLSVITNTDEEIVEDAISALKQLELMSVLDDGTYLINETQDMIGFETEWAKKKREYRDKIESEKGQTEDKPRTKKDNVRQEKEIEKELEIEKDKKNIYGEFHHVRMTPDQRDQLVRDYGLEMTESCITFLDEYIEMKGYKAKNHYLCIKKWVVDAVKEKKGKQSGNKNSLDDSYQMMSQWAKEGT